MTDVTTKRPLRVSTDGDVGPYLMVPLEQMQQVRERLNAHRVPHWVDEDGISVDGRPYIGVVEFGLREDAARIQVILDGE